MKPTKIEYHYSFKDLRQFIEQGRKTGDVGMLLTKEQNNFKTYRGYGTIENPCKDLMKMQLVANPLFDQPTRQSYSFHIFDTDEKKQI